MKKQLLPILRASVFVVASIAFAAHAVATEYTMRISHHWLPTLPTGRNIEQFAADVRAGTNGRVDVQIFPSAQLFKPSQQQLAVATAKIEAAVILDAFMGGSIPELNVTFIPYLMTDIQKIRKFPKSEAADLLGLKLQQKGLTAIAWIVETTGAMVTSAKKPLIGPEDFKGVKIRGLTKLFDTGLVAMGAAPAPMAGSEIYQALQTGVIDAAVTAPKTVNERKFFEVQRYGAVSRMGISNAIFVVNPDWWNGLPADIRKAIQVAADKASLRSAPTTDEVDPDDVKALREKGMAITILTPAQEKAMADAMQPSVLKEFKAVSPDASKLLDLIDRL